MKKAALFILVASLAVATPAAADFATDGIYGTASMKYWGAAPYQYVRITDTRPDVHFTDWRVPAGLEKVAVKSFVAASGADPIPYGGESLFTGTDYTRILPAFCIDVDDTVSPRDAYWVNVRRLDKTPDPYAGPMEATKASQLAWLLDNNAWGFSMTAADATALQLAVWEVVNEQLTVDGEYVYSISPLIGAADNFWAKASENPGAQTAAQALLDTMMSGWSAGYSFAGYVGLSNPLTGDVGKQDFVVRVPVPGAVLLGVLGLAAAGIRLRRFV